MVEKIINMLVTVVDKVLPVGNRYRTAILTTVIAITAILDAVGVTHGLYDVTSPVLWPLAVATGLSHIPTKKVDDLFHGQIFVPK